MNKEISGLKTNELKEEEYGEWLANEIKKKLQEKNWDEYDKLIKISRKRVYEVENKRIKK
jgi:hypothetical protein